MFETITTKKARFKDWRYVVLFEQKDDGLEQFDSYRTPLKREQPVMYDVQARYPQFIVSDVLRLASGHFHAIVTKKEKTS